MERLKMVCERYLKNEISEQKFLKDAQIIMVWVFKPIDCRNFCEHMMKFVCPGEE